MKITVKGKNLNVTDTLKLYAEKKVANLGKYSQNIREAVVTQSVQKNRHIVEIQLEGGGLILRAEESSENMYASIDLAVEKLETQLRRFKSKLLERLHPEAPPKEMAALAAEESGAVEEYTPRIVRTKKFPLKPMSQEEAAWQMELLNHDFYIFLNADTEDVNLIYKRKDGDFGLIEPES